MTERYAQPGHSGSQDGTIENPYITGQAAFDVVNQGDQIFLRTPIVDEGTTTSTSTDELVDTGQTDFLTTVAAGDTVHNVTDTSYTTVFSVDSNTTLTLDDDIMVSGDDYEIFGKDAAYGELITPTQVGAGVNPIIVRGFNIAIDEDPPVRILIDGVSGANNYGFAGANCDQHAFQNIAIKDVTVSCWEVFGSSTMTFRNCLAEGAVQEGIHASNNVALFECEFIGCEDSTDILDNCWTSSCRFSAADDNLLVFRTGAVVNSLFYGTTGADDMAIFILNPGGGMISNCTLDGESITDSIGVWMFNGNANAALIVNNIIYNWDVFVQYTLSDHQTMPIIGYNLVNTDVSTPDGYLNLTPMAGTDVTSAPDFEDESSRDYHLKSTSPARGEGTDVDTIP